MYVLRMPGKTVVALVVGVLAAAVGGAAGYVLAPSRSDELALANKNLATATTAARIEKDAAEGAAKRLEIVTKDKVALEQKIAAAAEAEKQAAAARAASAKKLEGAIDASAGSVITKGEAIHIVLPEKALFDGVNLTSTGKALLATVAKSLAEFPDDEIWVQGHSDDQAPAKKKLAKFASNWEVTSTHALRVVHYLQDVANVKPTRLVAQAFSEYRPISKGNRTQNRRVEIVLIPAKKSG